MKELEYGISKWIPFQDAKEAARVRKIKKEDICKHSNPNFKISILSDLDFVFTRVMDIFSRIQDASNEGRRMVMMWPQIIRHYSHVAYLINKFKVDCSNLYIINVDEYADENGNIRPEESPRSFLYALKKNFYFKIDKELRPPENHMIGFTNKNIKDFDKIIEDLGGVDVFYCGIGWSGHIAFIEPGAKEFEGSFEEWKQMGSRIVTLNPFTIAQVSLQPRNGSSGDWSMIPPKGATVGPAQVINARHRCSFNPFVIGGSNISFQRFIIRLAAHGPVTQLVPASIYQTLNTDLYILETLAEDIQIVDEVGLE